MRLLPAISLYLFYSFIFCISLQAQESPDAEAGRLSPKEFSIPVSPIFDLMGVTPSQINRTSDIKDFKVDWSFKSWRLNPNLAIQSQPFWEIFYNRRELSKYQEASGFMRRLASLDVSIGTVQNEENDRRIGFAAKINLFKEKDPLLAKELYEDISLRFQDERKDLESRLKELRLTLDTIQDIMQKPALREQIKSTEVELLSLNTRRNAEINSRALIFTGEHWNASSLDFAFGKINTYQTDSSGSLRKLRLNRNTGWGMWLNGGFGLGKRMMVSGLLRATRYEEELDFILRDVNTGDESFEQAVADNTLYTVGLNLRYGGPLYNFFVEFLYERKGLKTPLQAVNDAFKSPSGLEIVESSLRWSVVHPNSVSFGGDWRISRNVIINYGMRCIFDRNWKFQTFTPVASIACMMR